LCTKATTGVVKVVTENAINQEHLDDCLDIYAKMQRWESLLSAYDYDIEYRRSASHANCDALLRLPNPESSSEGMKGQVFAVKLLDDNVPVFGRGCGKSN